VSIAKTAEPIEMQFEMMSRVGPGPGMHSLDVEHYNVIFGILLLLIMFTDICFRGLFMVALWNRSDHYIFMLWFNCYGRPM